MNWWGGVGDTGQHKAIRYHAQVDVLKQPFIWLMILSQQFWQGSAGQFSQPQRVHSFIYSAASQLGNSVLGLAGCQLEKREQLGHKSFIIQQTNPEFFIW